MSGDEDNAAVVDIDEQMRQSSLAQGRMNLYMIPELTQSTAKDTARYRKAHDLGPHPNLVPMCDESAEARVAEYGRQITKFTETFGVAPRSVRNHAAGWVGYLDLVKVQERHGIRMDANYFSGRVFRERNQAPYSPFGGALPIRFTEPDGHLYQVFQQHTQLNDDVWFAPDRPYSYKFTAGCAEPMMRRILDQLANRFRMPLTANFHPGNWYFAKAQAMSLMQWARDHGIACWSLDQWLDYWIARDTCELSEVSWDQNVLRFSVTATHDHPDLCVELPERWGDLTLAALRCGGRDVSYERLAQYESTLVRMRVPCEAQAWAVEAQYL